MKRGDMRYDEQRYAELLARTKGWSTRVENSAASVNTDQRTGQMPRNDVTPARQTGPAVAVQPSPPLESEVLAAVLAALRAHPRVGFVERMNSGMMKKGPHYVRFGFVGCPDILGMLKDGRFLAVEVKRPKGHVTEDQIKFLSMVGWFGGLGFVAFSADDVTRSLA